VNTPAKLGAYGLLLAAIFSGAAAIGAAAGPIGVSATQHASHDMTKENNHGQDGRRPGPHRSIRRDLHQSENH
jgi:hypothetical protein